MTPQEMAQAAALMTNPEFKERYEQMRAQEATNQGLLKDAQDKLMAAQALVAHVEEREAAVDSAGLIRFRREEIVKRTEYVVTNPAAEATARKPVVAAKQEKLAQQHCELS